jgi:small multidrug resistance pump
MAMPASILLTIAIVSEVAATLALRMSHGFSRPLPVAIVVAGYAISFWFMAQVLKQLPVGLTYAVWSAVGTALIATFGIVAWGESATVLKIASLGLIIMGVVGLNLTSTH